MNSETGSGNAGAATVAELEKQAQKDKNAGGKTGEAYARQRYPKNEAYGRDADIFEAFINAPAPEITRVIAREQRDGIEIRKVAYRSLPAEGGDQEVYALLAKPAAPGSYPGLLALHGGAGSAWEQKAVEYARAGYVTVAPDLPGIANSASCPYSTGPWKSLNYDKMNEARWQAGPDGRASILFDAVVAGLQAFHLLASQPEAQTGNLGIFGVSWGGYLTTMLAGLLGEQVKAAFAVFGCGFYDKGSVFRKRIGEMPEEEQKIWYRDLDAGRRAPGIRAAFFMGAAAKDYFFWPPAVLHTYRAIPGEKNIAFGTEGSHSLADLAGETDPFGGRYVRTFFDFRLRGIGGDFPKVGVKSCTPHGDDGLLVKIEAVSESPIRYAGLAYSLPDAEWPERVWRKVRAEDAGNGLFEAVLPAQAVGAGADWFAEAVNSLELNGCSPFYEQSNN